MLTTELLIITALILLNGFFALSEMALVSSKRARLQSAADRGSRGAKVALQLLADPTNFLSAIQVGITLIGILTGLYSGVALSGHLALYFETMGVPDRYGETAAYAVVVTTITYFSLVIGELVPKRVALSHAESFAIFVAPIMRWFAIVMSPLVWLLRGTVELVLKLLPVSSAPAAAVTEDEVRSLIAEATQTGVFHASEKKLLEGVLALADRKLESIMVPRQDVVWLDLDETLDELWEQARTSGHARFLAAHGALDQLVGVLTLANLSEALRRGSLDEQRDIDPPLHVPVGISILRVLNLFQTSSTHLAIVTDEYGDIKGVVTPIDVLRAIVGELQELGSRERPEIVRREDGSLLVDGHLAIEELQQHFNRKDMASGDFHTLAGFVLARLGRIPKAGESLTWSDLRIEVVDMDGVRIDKLLIAVVKKSATAK